MTGATTITAARMRDWPVGLRARIRELSLGPIAWGAWSWTFHDGSCWAALAFDGDGVREDKLVGWAALTMEVDLLPVVGVFVREDRRRSGLGEQLLSGLLSHLKAQRELSVGDAVFCSAWRWSKYERLIEAHGFRCLPWK